MNKFLFTFFLIFTLVIPLSLFAQQDSTEAAWDDSTDTQESWQDSTDNDNDWDSDEWSNDDWKDDWNFEFDDHDYFDFEFMGKPYIEVNYGVSTSKIKSLKGSFNKPGFVDVKLGYSSLMNYEDYVIKYRNRFLFLSNLSRDFNSAEKKGSELNLKMWRFGAGSIDGYGYSFGQSAIIPYTSNSLVWSKLDLQDYPLPYVDNITAAALTDTAVLKEFNGTFRFGTYTEAGLKIQIIPLITLNGSFERAIIFPRHMFWKHLGSMAIEWIGIGAVEIFTKEVLESSPAAGPIINFLLKNAVTFGLYQLRREKMNWPFKTVEPLAIDTWKVGVTFTF